MFDSEDDDDFMFTPSSKLASIFSPSNADKNNASLTYRAPKQPKASEGKPKPETTATERNGAQSQSKVIMAKTINLWKLENGKNKPMGLYMMALIGDSSKNQLELIVYQEKTNLLIRQALGPSLIIHRNSKNVVLFYDKEKQLWSLSFDSSDSLQSFLDYAIKSKCVIANENEQDSTTSTLDNSKTVTNISPQTVPKEANSKEKILSKVSKMGQPILPRAPPQNRSSDLSDSETESSCSNSRTIKPSAAPRKAKRNLNHQDKALAPIVTENNNFVLPQSQLRLNQHSAGLVYSQPIPDYGLTNLILAQNAELKANLAEINLKLSGALKNPDANGNDRENVNVLNSKIKCLNLKVDNLSDELEKAKGARHDLGRRYDEKCRELEEIKGKLRELEAEFEALKKRGKCADDLQGEVEVLKKELEETRLQESRVKDFEELYEREKAAKEQLLKENEDLMEKIREQAPKIDDYQVRPSPTGIDKDHINRVVKERMNEAFASIMEHFDDSSVYAFHDIQGPILANLKKTSYSLIQSLLP